jgi:hypothetical protein
LTEKYLEIEEMALRIILLYVYVQPDLLTASSRCFFFYLNPHVLVPYPFFEFLYQILEHVFLLYSFIWI